MLILSILWLVLGMLPLAAGLVFFYYGYTNFGPVAAAAWSRPWLVWGEVFTALIGLLALAGFLRSRPRVRVYAAGIDISGTDLLLIFRPRRLACVEIGGIAVQAVTYADESTSQNPRAAPFTAYRVVLFPKKSRPITLSGQSDGKRGIINIVELSTRLKAALYPRLHAELSAAFRQGQEVAFGPLLASRAGLRFRSSGQAIPWQNVQHVSVRGGYLVVELAPGREKRFSISKIPNPEILLQLIQEWAR